MSDKAKDKFQKVAGGAAVGGGVLFAAGALLPLIPALPLVIPGALVGGYLAHKGSQGNNKGNNKKNPYL